MPGFGFAIGMERLVMLLKDSVQRSAFSVQPLVFMITLGEKAEKTAMPLMKTLRSQGMRLERDYGSKGIKAQMKKADKLGARFVLILGDDELAENSITIKNMQSGEQGKVPLNQGEERLKLLMEKA